MIYILVYYITAIGMTPGGSSRVHKQYTEYRERTYIKIKKKIDLCTYSQPADEAPTSHYFSNMHFNMFFLIQD
jgi:hypothetical protein